MYVLTKLFCKLAIFITTVDLLQLWMSVNFSFQCNYPLNEEVKNHISSARLSVRFVILTFVWSSCILSSLMCWDVSVFQFKAKVWILDGSEVHDWCKSSIFTFHVTGNNKLITGLFENIWINDSVLLQTSLSLLFMAYFEWEIMMFRLPFYGCNISWHRVLV